MKTGCPSADLQTCMEKRVLLHFSCVICCCFSCVICCFVRLSLKRMLSNLPFSLSGMRSQELRKLMIVTGSVYTNQSQAPRLTG